MTAPTHTSPSQSPSDQALRLPAKSKLRWSRRSTVRSDFIKACIAFAVFFVLTRNTAFLHLLEIFLVAFAAVVAWPFIQAPWLMYRRYSVPIHLPFRRVEGQVLPAGVQNAISCCVPQLTDLGFEFASYLAQERKTVTTVIALMIHRANQDSAYFAWFVTGLKTIQLLAFQTRFDDGFSVSTSDQQRGPMFQPNPLHPVFRFPKIRSAADLYQLHRKLKPEFSANRSAILGGAIEEIAYFIERAEQHREEIMNQGDYKLAPSGESYVFTRAGACRHAWLQAWPVAFLREVRNEAAARRKAKELGFRIDLKTGGIAPYHKS
jgi:hypothetical protein